MRSRRLTMKNKWIKKITTLSLCMVMAAEPMMAGAADSIEIAEVEEQVQGSAITEEDDREADIEDDIEEDTAENDQETEAELLMEEFTETEEEVILSPDEETGITEEADALAVEDSDVTYSGTCGANVTWEVRGSVMTVSGSGAMNDGRVGDGTQTFDRDQITEIYISDGVTSVGNSAFSWYKNLRKAVVGNSVKTIGDSAFRQDENLTELTLGNSVEVIRGTAFGETGLQELVLPSSLKSLWSMALYGMDQLENITISANETYQTKDGALYTNGGKTLYFYPSKKTGEYTIPEGVTEIANDAFNGTNLTKLVIADSVTRMGEYAFSNSKTLQTIVFGKGIKVISRCCCSGNTALTTVTIPEGVTTVENEAFVLCPALKEVTLPCSVTSEDNAFPANTNVTRLNPKMESVENGGYVDAFKVNATVTELYQNAFDMLDLVNAERRKYGVQDLVMDTGLLETAMQRATECVIYNSHTRPNGFACNSANGRSMGENITRYGGTPQEAMEWWMNSLGHRANILMARYTSIGVGCVYANGSYYWLQCFGTDTPTQANRSAYSDRVHTRKVQVKRDKEYYTADIGYFFQKLTAGETKDIYVFWKSGKLQNTGAVFESSDPSICEIKDNKVIAKRPGTVTITMYFEEYREAAVTDTVTVVEKQPDQKPGQSSSGYWNEEEEWENDDSRTDSNKSDSSKKDSGYVTNGYRITYYPNGGQDSAITKTVKKKAKIGSLPKAKRKGYLFAGWYTSSKKGKKVSASTKVTGNMKLYAHWTKVKAAKVSLKKPASKKGRKVTVSWKKVSGAKGYQILYADNAKMKGANSVIVKKTSTTLKNLQKGKKCYIKVRAYKTDSAGKKVFGAYSSTKKILIK